MSDGDLKNDIDAPCAKKLKNSEQNDNSVSENQFKLKDFIPEKILQNNTLRKTICVQGKIRGKTGVALILFEKNAFKEEDLNDTGYFSSDTELETFFHNDIYGNYVCFPRPSINSEFYFLPPELSNIKVFFHCVFGGVSGNIRHHITT